MICMVACNSDTEIEVIPEPETVQEPIQEPEPMEEPEPVIETIYLPTLESWGIQDGELEIVNGNCDPAIFRGASFPGSPMNLLTTDWELVPGKGVKCSKHLFNVPFALDLPKNGPTRRTLVHPNDLVFVKSGVGSGAVGGYMVTVFKKGSDEFNDRVKVGETCGEPLNYANWDISGYENGGLIVEGRWKAIRMGSGVTFCVSLEPMSGAVKCVITESRGQITRNSENSVALYRNGEFEILEEGFVSQSPTALWLFGGTSQADYEGKGRLCHLFRDGPIEYGPLECEVREERIRCFLNDPDPQCQPSEDDPTGTYKVVEVEHCYRDEI